MSGFADLVLQAQPALISDGCTARATEGMTWRWQIGGVTDATGAPVDLTSITGTCTIWDKPGGTSVTTLTFTGAADGSFTLYKDEAATVGLASGADSRGTRLCYWSLTLSNGTDTVAVWSAPTSKFTIAKG